MSQAHHLLQAPRFVDAEVDLDAAAALTIAAAMREVAECDGEHHDELAIIRAFEGQLPGPATVVDLTALTTDEHREVFLKSLVLVAFADGVVSEQERVLIEQYAEKLGMDQASRTRAWTEVASALLSVFSGIRNFRDQIVLLGESMGLDRNTIDGVLG